MPRKPRLPVIAENDTPKILHDVLIDKLKDKMVISGQRIALKGVKKIRKFFSLRFYKIVIILLPYASDSIESLDKTGNLADQSPR